MQCCKRERVWMDFPHVLSRQLCSSTDELGTGVAWVRILLFGGFSPTLKLLVRGRMSHLQTDSWTFCPFCSKSLGCQLHTAITVSNAWLLCDRICQGHFLFLASYNFLWKAVWFGGMVTFRKVSAIVMNSQTQSVTQNLYNFTTGDLKSIFWNVAAFFLTATKKHFALPPADVDRHCPAFLNLRCSVASWFWITTSLSLSQP